MREFVIEIHTLNVYDSKDTVQYYNDIEIHKRQLISVVTLTVESMAHYMHFEKIEIMLRPIQLSFSC